jgi:hypothetical protein
MNEKEVAPDLLVISCEEDYQTCAPLLEKGQTYYTHHAYHTVFFSGSGHSANVPNRCECFQRGVSAKRYRHSEAGVREVSEPKSLLEPSEHAFSALVFLHRLKFFSVDVCAGTAFSWTESNRPARRGG